MPTGRKPLTPRVHGDVVILDLDGKMWLSDDNQLQASVVALIGQGFLRFVLNFAQLPYMDSMTLGAVVRAYTTVRRHGGRLVLLHLHSRIRALLDVRELTRVIEAFDSEEGALQSFEGFQPEEAVKADSPVR